MLTDDQITQAWRPQRHALLQMRRRNLMVHAKRKEEAKAPSYGPICLGWAPAGVIADTSESNVLSRAVE
jgi:hypothetical protein